MTTKQRLELTWIGKGEQPVLEPRILIEDPEKSYGDKNTENMLIYGDNLLALKALEQEYAGKIMCIYIDPPYNTGSAFTHYDDGLEHSIWLTLMRERLCLLWRLLHENGSIWISIDDNECHYLKVLCDEILGRKHFLADVIWQHSIQAKNDAKTFSLHHNHILCYSKNEKYITKRLPRQEKHNVNYSNPDNDPRGAWRSGDVRSPNFRENLKYEICSPSGKIIKPPEKGWRWSKSTLEDKIQSGEVVFSLEQDKIIRKIYLSEQEGRVAETIWFGEEVGTTREANSELKLFEFDDTFDTPKPERLIKRILQLSTEMGDYTLDSFLGSGTTSAVAHKMGRKWIGIELGDHCHTHCIPRLQKVCDGTDQGGISESVGWNGGGGFKYYYLAPSLLKKDKFNNWVINAEYNADMLAAAMAKHEGFKYQPDPEKFWKQGTSSEKDYILTTTNHITIQYLDMIHEEMQPDESLLICCKSFSKACEGHYPNINIKKIPKALFGKCEFGKEDYSLNIITMPNDPNAPEFIPVGKTVSTEKLPERLKNSDQAPSLFDNGGEHE